MSELTVHHRERMERRSGRCPDCGGPLAERSWCSDCQEWVDKPHCEDCLVKPYRYCEDCGFKEEI